MLMAMIFAATIQGTVVASDGSPLPGATVTLIRATRLDVTVANAKGEFTFANVATLEGARLRAELAGLETREVRADSTMPATIVLKLAPQTAVTICCDCGGLGPPLLPMDSVSTFTLSHIELSKLPF